MEREPDPPVEPTAPPTSVIGCLAAAATRRPDALAVRGSDGSFTFRELLGAAQHLAARLEEEPAGFVAILVPSLASSIAAQFGAAATGRPFLPLDPEFPVPALNDMVDTVGPVVFVAPPDLVGLAEELAGGRPVIAWEAPDEVPEPTAVVDHPADQDLVVYFTSGSTGRPKALVQTQRNWVSSGLGLVDHGLSTPDDHYLLLPPLGFAAAGIITSFALFGGASLTVHDSRALGLLRLPDEIRRLGITVLMGTTSSVRVLLGATDGDPLPSVRHVLFGGEVVVRSDLELARTVSDRVSVSTLYASTELGAISLRTVWSGEPLPDEDPVHSGFPEVFGGIRSVSVVDEDGLPCAPGLVGEVIVECEAMYRELGAPEARGVGRNATGDVGRVLADGGLQLIGRTDQVVKLRGFRIDLGDVERHLRDLDDVVDAAIVLGTSPRGTDRLVGFIVPAPGAEVTVESVRASLFDRVPGYMVPAVIELVEAIPRLRNLKVDRRALKERARTPSDGAGRSTVAAPGPQSPAEKAIVKIFEDLLGIPSIAADEDFFDLGGSSLDVAELLLRIETDLGVQLPASVLTRSSSPHQLAAAASEAIRSADRSSVVSVQAAASSTRRPVYLAYDLHGSPFRLRQLAVALGADQPVLGFECPLIFGTSESPTTMREIAALHVRDLLATQPEGPYHLCGYSVGSILAFEVASQLVAAGHELGVVALIDFGPVHMSGPLPRRHGPKPPGTYPVRPPATARALERVRFHADHLRSSGWFDRGAHAARQLGVGREYELALARVDLARTGLVRPELRASWTWYTLLNAALGWVPGPASLDLDLFLCDQTAKGNIVVSRRVDQASRERPTLGWDDYARSVAVHPVVGYHNDLVEPPYVNGVGAAVRATLDGWADR